MDRLRQVLGRIAATLKTLTPTQRLLAFTSALALGMALLLVVVWTGKADMIELLPTASAGEQKRAATSLASLQIPHKIGPGGKLLVPVEMKYSAMAALSEDNALPADNVLTFNNLADKSPWTMSEEQRRQQERIAVQNELSRIISKFRGVKQAAVILDVPQAGGLGQSVRKPTASATVFTASGAALDQDTVDAVAHLIASSRAGLTTENVRVIDGSTNRQHRAKSDSSASSSNYLEHAAKVEDRVRTKLLDMLGYIPGVVVAVNAQVDVRQKESSTTKVLDSGKGTVTAPKRETTSTRDDSEQTPAAEPGIRSNVGLDINRSGGGGTKSTDTQSEAEMETQFGKMVERVVDPRGMPIKINATINIPRAYFAARWRDQQGAAPAGGGAANAGPTDADLEPIAQKEIERISADVKPQVDASLAAGPDAPPSQGEVVVSMIPDTGAAAGLEAALAGAGGGVASMLGGGPMVKTVGLGALALVAVGMMLMMIRKSSKSETLPTAEELVGIPPTLGRTSDLVGEADEADNVMSGIELSDQALLTRKMREQVEEAIKAKPEENASLLNRWINVHE